MRSESAINEIEASLTADLVLMQAEILAAATEILEEDSVNLQSFHARIGRWNTTFVDSIRVQFSDPKDFIAKWVAGLLAEIRKIEDEQRKKYKGRIYQNSVLHRLLKLLKNSQIREYIFLFLERNFYRNFRARIRAKPEDHLWQLWFGRGAMTWGILLAPAYRRNGWTNDVSEIRRCDYGYWTIGHLLETGLIDPECEHPINWSNFEQFLAFYRSVLKRESNSAYEQQVADCYIEYLRKSSDPLSEPFLIPELRYAGLEKLHEHRLDFAVFNSHTMELTGFELSPASTHMSIKGIKKDNKTQIALNTELSGKWEKEMAKRNKYFDKFSIPIITFTDSNLKDINQCFSGIRSKLAARPEISISYKESISQINNFKLA